MEKEIGSFFDRVYIINLKSRPDRRLEMIEQLKRIGLSLESRNIVLFEAIKPTDPCGFPSVGARGCFMSNLQVLRQARDERLSRILILEDDLNFCEGFRSRFDAVASYLEVIDWGMFYGSYLVNQSLQPSGQLCRMVDPRMAIGTTAFVAFNGQHVDTLVRYLEAMLMRAPGDPDGGPMHIDGAYCWFRRFHPEVSTWVATQPLGFQRSSRTDINPLRWYDRTPGPAWIVALLRRLRNAFSI
jgi:hypothetical protein